MLAIGEQCLRAKIDYAALAVDLRARTFFTFNILCERVEQQANLSVALFLCPRLIIDCTFCPLSGLSLSSLGSGYSKQ
jgi:hypothetical protein